MKIVDDKPDPSVVKQTICRNCGIKIEYVPNDVVTLWSRTDFFGEPDGATGFKCPKCGENVVLRRW